MTILAKLYANVSRKTQLATQPAKAGQSESNRDKSRLAVSPDTRVSQHAEGLTLLHLPTGQIFVCNRTAARIWQGATEGRSVEELSADMSVQFSIAAEIAKKDTASIVGQMQLHGLIVRTGI